jgi:polysaccharide export outer membrane protein
MSLTRVLSKYIVFVFVFFSSFQMVFADENVQHYKIGIGDVLKINVWKEPELSVDESVVRNDGNITFPLLDDIKAHGLTTVELKQIIEKGLKEYIEAPNVTVTLIGPVSQKFYILGEILRTGEYPLIKNLTVMQAFALAGGFTEWASKNKILLIRRDKGKDQTITIKYDDILKGDLSMDIPLIANDTIIVP